MVLIGDFQTMRILKILQLFILQRRMSMKIRPEGTSDLIVNYNTFDEFRQSILGKKVPIEYVTFRFLEARQKPTPVIFRDSDNTWRAIGEVKEGRLLNVRRIELE